jgi:hypothetical protein
VSGLWQAAVFNGSARFADENRRGVSMLRFSRLLALALLAGCGAYARTIGAAAERALGEPAANTRSAE